ncbi:MAG: choice-of-anchor B domain-containing protein [Planctomycetota bacterium]
MASVFIRSLNANEYECCLVGFRPLLTMRNFAVVLFLLMSTSLWAQGLGTHDQYESSGVTLTGWLPCGDFGNSQGADDCWGYTSASGREYAIIGTTSDIGFAEITNPSEPVVVAALPTMSSNWHDIKTYQEYAYSVSEGGGGIHVFDLSAIDLGIVTSVTNVTTGGAQATHNVAIDEASGFLYRCDGGGFQGGLRIYSLANPALPTLVTTWTGREVHDAQVVSFTSGPFANRQIGFLASHSVGFDGLTIVDLTVKTAIVILGSVEYPNQSVAHQGWLSDDQTIFYYGDEADEISSGFTTRTMMFDVSDLTNPTYIGAFTNGNTASDHNLYAKGSKLFEANFMSGLRVYDLTDPINPIETAYFDTQISSDVAKTEGLWGNYPFFASGTIIGSDEVKGLFIWRLGDPQLTFSFPQGLPDPISPDGESIRVDINEAVPGALAGGTPTLHVLMAGAEIDLPLIEIGPGEFIANVPASNCGEVSAYRISARSTDNMLWRSPASTEDNYHFALSAYSENVLIEYDMESATGWVGGVAGDTASAGAWVRDVPRGTAAQTEIDHSPGATQTMCWVTGQATVGLDNSVGDVDSGLTTLLSPVLALAGMSDVRIDYWRWYHNTSGSNPQTDIFTIQVTNDGVNWTTVERIGPTGPEIRGGWRRHAFRVEDYVALTNSVQVRFRASDVGLASVVEAAVDDFRVIEIVCGDCNANGTADATDIMNGSSLDLDGNGLPDECQSLSADVATVSLSAGGQQSFSLDAGEAHGSMVYWMFGSFTGTAPGLQLGEILLPLNFDAYFRITLNNPGFAIFGNFLSSLDPAGHANASFNMPAGTDPSLMGVTLYHAYLAASSVGSAHFASNAIPVTFGM